MTLISWRKTGLLFWHCVHDQWTRFDRLSPDNFFIFQLLYQSLSGTTKNTDEDCKLAVETLQESVKVCQSRSRSCCVIPYTHQPGKTFSLTASIVLFSDPLETAASVPHRIKISISVNPLVFS